MKKLKINMLSQATSVDGQGVGSAYLEQVALVKESDDLFTVSINSHSSKFDIYHFHTVNPQYRLRFNKHHVNVAYVHFIPTTLDGSIKLPKLLFKVFKKYVVNFYKSADEIVVVNPSFIPPLVELGIKKENITYIPNFVDHESFHKVDDATRNEIRKKYGIPLDKFVVMGCGQVQTRKGVKDFVEVAKRNPDICFIWAGGFSFGKMTDGYKELKAIVDNPPQNVKFLGIIPRVEMNDIYNLSDVLFMPSLSELFPMAILEAVNSFKPILLRDLDLYKEILFEKYAKGIDVESFDCEIKRLSTDSSYYQAMSDNSKDISIFYSKEHVKNIWREYYPRVYNKWKDKKRIKK